MALTVTFDSIRAAIRSQLDASGSTARARHPESAIDDAAARGIAALYRLIYKAGGKDRFLTTATLSLVANTATYALPATFGHAVLVEHTLNSQRRYLNSYEQVDHPALTSPVGASSGTPAAYKIYASVIEFAPVPASAQTVTLWYVPNVAQPSGDEDQTFDSIARLDDYAVLYATKWLARSDKAFDLMASCDAGMAEIKADAEWFLRHRDANGPSRVRDVRSAERYRFPGERR